MTKEVLFDMIRFIIEKPRISSHKSNYKGPEGTEDVNYFLLLSHFKSTHLYQKKTTVIIFVLRREQPYK